jgi:predicted nucleic acid-binding protein
MKAAYIDSSVLVAILLQERGWADLERRLGSFDHHIAANLLEAELRSAMSREGLSEEKMPDLAWMEWIQPTRPLGPEFQRVLNLGHQKGADLWHLACALFASPTGGITFLTLDERQRQAAVKLGFST